MRSSLSVVLILVLVLSLTGCASSTGSNEIDITSIWGLSSNIEDVTVTAKPSSPWVLEQGTVYDVTRKPLVYKDGVYAVQSMFYDQHSWASVMVAEVKNGKLVKVSFNDFNSDGVQTHTKTSDVGYNATMMAILGASPEVAYPKLQYDLVYTQDSELVDTVSGVTSSSESFKELSRLLIERAKVGSTDTLLVDLHTVYKMADRAPKSDGYIRQATIDFNSGTNVIKSIRFDYVDSTGKSIVGDGSTLGSSLVKVNDVLSSSLVGKSEMKTAILSGDETLDNEAFTYVNNVLAMRKPVAQDILVYQKEVLNATK